MNRLKLMAAKPLVARKTVGVIGLLQSGKTVLMTSLIDHLRNHDNDRFPMGRSDLTLVDAEPPKPRRRFAPFKYEQYRADLSRGKWPQKTLEGSEFRSTFVRSDWKLQRLDLSLIEIPGERLADMSIACCRTFGDWSDYVLATLRNSPETAEAANLYLVEIERLESACELPLDMESLLSIYRQAMASLIVASIPLVTPSSLLIDAEDKYIKVVADLRTDGELATEIAAKGYVGLGVDRQFAPVPVSLRKRYPDAVQQMSQHYQAYRRTLVLPMATGLKQCTELVVLVDIAMLLEGGVGMLNANQTLLRQVIQYVTPGFSFFARHTDGLLRLLTVGHWRLNGVRRITFVATKADRVHESDRGKLVPLMKEVFQPVIKAHQALTDLDVRYKVCAAAESIVSIGEDCDRSVQFHVNGEVKQMTPSVVPESWPNEWNVGDFVFPHSKPWMPANRNNPPRQFGLNEVAAILFS